MRDPLNAKRKSASGLSKGTMAAIGGRIRDVRFRLDRTEQGFARLLGVETETVALWESGCGVDREALNRIADLTDATVEWLIAGVTPPKLAAIFAAAASPRPEAATTAGTAFAQDRSARDGAGAHRARRP